MKDYTVKEFLASLSQHLPEPGRRVGSFMGFSGVALWRLRKRDWSRWKPRVETLEKLLESLGYELVIRKRE